MNYEQKKSRRDFMSDLARGGVLAVLGTLGFSLARKSVISRSEQVCTGQGYCRGCERQDDCGLPAAISARNSGAGREPTP